MYPLRELISRANRTLRVRGGFRPMRTLRLRGDSHNPTSASRLPAEASAQAGTRRSALAPFRLSMLFLFRRGIFLKLNGRKRGSVGLLLRKKQSESNANSILSLVSFVIASGSSSPWGPSSASASDISARATRAYMSRFGAFPRTPALRCGCSGAMLFGGERNPPPSFGLLLAVVC